MNFDKLTHNDAGKSVTPRSPKDWEEWVSARKLRGHLLGDTLGDWLDRYGERCGFVCNSRRRDYDPRLNLFTFVAEKGIEFEATVASYLASRGDSIWICGTREDIRNLDMARETLAALVDGREIVHQGVLWHPETVLGALEPKLDAAVLVLVEGAVDPLLRREIPVRECVYVVQDVPVECCVEPRGIVVGAVEGRLVLLAVHAEQKA